MHGIASSRPAHAGHVQNGRTRSCTTSCARPSLPPFVQDTSAPRVLFFTLVECRSTQVDGNEPAPGAWPRMADTYVRTRHGRQRARARSSRENYSTVAPIPCMVCCIITHVGHVTPPCIPWFAGRQRVVLVVYKSTALRSARLPTTNTSSSCHLSRERRSRE
jgi:hypothetical protein